MGVPHITSFCWCMGLELASKFIGVLHLVLSFAMMIICSIFAVQTGAIVGTTEDMDYLYTTVYKVSTGVAIFTIVHVLLACILLYSVFKRKATGVCIWVMLMSLLCVGALLTVVVLSFTHGLSGSGSEIFVSFLEGLVFFALLGYCILCVYSYYLLLRSAEDMEGPPRYKSDY